MIIFKIFIILVLTVFIWLLLQLLIGGLRLFAFFKTVSGFADKASHVAKAARAAQAKRGATKPKPKAVPQSTMVKCAACNLYVLDTDAISHKGLYFCSPEHAKQA